jgi:eukaryotic-like serine/threonine-protein kinase
VVIAPPPLAEAFHGRYALERELGRGGMAVVYLARDLKHDRPVALKVVRPDLASLLGGERFLREIRFAARLQHPAIVPVHDSGEADGLLYYVMPFIEGESLRARLSREGQLPLEDALQITREVAGALSYAHRHGVVHRDIKPENILLSAGHSLVLDFGIAHAIAPEGPERLTATGLVVGTPSYMSPEQATGTDRPDLRSDIYSLGCVLYEMLVGEPPYTGPTPRAIIARRLSEPIPDMRTVREGVPEGVARAVMCALAKVPADRFATAAEFAAALAVGGAGSVRQSVTLAAQGENSIAVLPFASLSAEKDNEFFADGMTDEIINALGQVGGIRIAARSSSFAFKGKEADARAVGERLSVRTLLQGSVRKSGDRVRIVAQLVNAADGYQLWSQIYERTLADVFAVQDELARAIVGALTQRVVRSGEAPLVKPPTAILEAYTLFLRGRYLVNQRTADGYRASIPCFEQAIGLDPEFAAAHAALAYPFAMLGLDMHGGMPGIQAAPRAKAAALRAHELDPSLPEAHLSLAIVAMYFEYDWPTAESELLQTMALSPHWSVAALWYSLFLGAMDRREESIRVVARASVDDPLNFALYVGAGLALIRARRFDAAIAQFRTVLGMLPNYQPALSELARAYCYKGALDLALAELEKGMAAIGRRPQLLMRVGCVHALAGRRSEAFAILDEIRQEAAQRYVPAIYQGHLLCALGDLDAAIRFYELAYDERSSRLAHARTDPEWDPVRSHPWFLGFLKRLHLDPSG